MCISHVFIIFYLRRNGFVCLWRNGCRGLVTLVPKLTMTKIAVYTDATDAFDGRVYGRMCHDLTDAFGPLTVRTHRTNAYVSPALVEY